MKEEHQVEGAELRRYLLGELTLEERVLIEERMFLDDEYVQLARAAEDELVDDYANRELTTAERERFETHFLAQPGHRDDLRIAQALKRFLDSEAESPAAAHAPGPIASRADSGVAARPAGKGFASFLPSLFGRRAALGFSFAAALVMLSVVAWLALASWRQEGRQPTQARDPEPQPTAPGPQGGQESANANADNSQSPGGGGQVAGGRDRNQPPATPGGRPEDGPAGRQGGRPQAAPPPSRVVAFLLLPGGGVRGEGQGKGVLVTADVGTVVLRLPLVEGGDYRTYRATLEAGGTARTFDRLTAEADPELGKVVPVKVPADLLRRPSYRIRLGGVDADGRVQSLTSYSFTVERR